MALHRGQVILAATSGVPADACTNTWYIGGVDGGAVVTGFEAVRQFYIDWGNSFSDLIDAANSRIDIYAMDDPEPRRVVYSVPMTGLTVGGSSGVNEVALVMSYQAGRVSGEPQARRRGRVYIGPLSSTGSDRPSAGNVTKLRDAGADLLAASVGQLDWTWMQYSPTNDLALPVESGWVDNEWDTQRRRGRKATSRTTF